MQYGPRGYYVPAPAQWPVDPRSLELGPPPPGFKVPLLPPSPNYPGPPDSETWTFPPEDNPTRDYRTGVQQINVQPGSFASPSLPAQGAIPSHAQQQGGPITFPHYMPAINPFVPENFNYPTEDQIRELLAPSAPPARLPRPRPWFNPFE